MVNIDYRDSRALYEQVKDGFRRLVITGVLSPGDRIPSVRDLAAQLAINPNTIQRAYRELEQEGYIYSVPGKGSFAGERREVDDTRRAALLKKLDEILAELRFLGMETPELVARVEQMGKKKEA